MTILRSWTLANLRRILSKPTSSTTLPEISILVEGAIGVFSRPTSEAYFSWRADTKLRGGSDSLVGRMKDAAVGELDWPVLRAGQYAQANLREGDGNRTFEVAHAPMAAIVLPPRAVIPLDA